jgi:hypothetical protein
MLYKYADLTRMEQTGRRWLGNGQEAFLFTPTRRARVNDE